MLLPLLRDRAAGKAMRRGEADMLPCYIEEGITGDALVELLHAELKEMGLNSVGHRLTILKGVYDVKVKQNITIGPEHYVPLCKDERADPFTP
jgi:protein STE50